MKLPELSVIDTHLPSNTMIRGYTVEQMLAWGKANAEAEREACAKVCDEINNDYDGEEVSASWIATAIRARGTT